MQITNRYLAVILPTIGSLLLVNKCNKHASLACAARLADTKYPPVAVVRAFEYQDLGRGFYPALVICILLSITLLR